MKKLKLLALIIFLISCNEENSNKITFTAKEFTPENFVICQAKKCPEIEIDFVVAQGSEEISKNINSEMEKVRISILANNPEKTKPLSFKVALKNFIEEYQNFQKDYPEFPAGYEIRISDEIAFHSEEIIVINTKHYLFTGGAHGYGASSYNTFSTTTGQLTKPKDLFTDLSAFTNFAAKKFREKYEIPASDSINSTGFFFKNNEFSLPENLAILKNDVVLLYNPYEAAAYARGKMELRIPKSEVQQWLKYE